MAIDPTTGQEEDPDLAAHKQANALAASQGAGTFAQRPGAWQNQGASSAAGNANQLAMQRAAQGGYAPAGGSAPTSTASALTAAVSPTRDTGSPVPLSPGASSGQLPAGNSPPAPLTNAQIAAANAPAPTSTAAALGASTAPTPAGQKADPLPPGVVLAPGESVTKVQPAALTPSQSIAEQQQALTQGNQQDAAAIYNQNRDPEADAGNSNLGDDIKSGFAKIGNTFVKSAAQATADMHSQTQQANEGGVTTAQAQTSAGGVLGLFGQTKEVNNYQAGNVADNTQHDTDQIQGQIKTQQQQAAAIQNRAIAQGQSTDATAATIDQAPQNQVRGQQLGLADLLTQSATGQGPSAAQTQLQQATDQNISQQLALAASARGVNPAVAAREAAQNSATIGQQAALQSAQTKVSEEQGARSQLGTVLDQARGTDVGLATSQAGLTQAAALQNAQNATTTSNSNAALTASQNTEKDTAQASENEQITKLMGLGYTEDEARQQFALQQAQSNAALDAQQEAAREGVAVQTGGQQIQGAGAAVSAAASLLA